MEPLGGVHHVSVREHRTAVDWAEEIKYLVDVMYPDGISVSGMTESILYSLQQAHEKKSKTVLITAHKNGRISSYCDEIVLIPSLKYLNYGNVISPQFPILIFLDIIYSYYVSMDKRRMQVLHTSTLRALNRIQEESI